MCSAEIQQNKSTDADIQLNTLDNRFSQMSLKMLSPDVIIYFLNATIPISAGAPPRP